MSRKFYEGVATVKNWRTRTVWNSAALIARRLSGRYKVYREADGLQRLRVDVPVLLTTSIIGAVIFVLAGAAVLAYEKFFAYPEHAREVATLEAQVADVTAQLAEEQAKPKAQPATMPAAPTPKPSLKPQEIEAKKKVINDALALLNRVIKPAVTAARDSLKFSGPKGLEDTLEAREKWLRAYIDNLNKQWSGLWPILLKANTFANNQRAQWADIAAVMTISYADYNEDFKRLFSAANLLLLPGKTQELNVLAVITEAARENCDAKLLAIERAIDDARKKLVELREATAN